MFSDSAEKSGSGISIHLIVLAVLVFFDRSYSKEKKNPDHFKPQFIQAEAEEDFESLENAVSDLPVFSESNGRTLKASHLVPEVDTPEPETVQGIYFLKFFGSGNYTQSRLVRVQRTFRGDLKKRIRQALKALSSGPTAEEQKKGVISGLPERYEFGKKIRFRKGILHISLNETFTEEAGLDLMQDRIDQLCFSLLEFPEIKGVSIYVNGRKERYLGRDRLRIPSIIYPIKRKTLSI